MSVFGFMFVDCVMELLLSRKSHLSYKYNAELPCNHGVSIVPRFVLALCTCRVAICYISVCCHRAGGTESIKYSELQCQVIKVCLSTVLITVLMCSG